MKFLFEVEFFDSLKIMVIATSCQDVVNQCEARIRAFSNPFNKDCRIKSIRYIKEEK
jgi:hypothetical protein